MFECRRCDLIERHLADDVPHLHDWERTLRDGAWWTDQSQAMLRAAATEKLIEPLRAEIEATVRRLPWWGRAFVWLYVKAHR